MNDEHIYIDCPWCETSNVYGDLICLKCKYSLPLFTENHCEPKPNDPIRIIPKSFLYILKKEYFLYPLAFFLTTLLALLFCVINSMPFFVLFALLGIFASSIGTLYGYYKYLKIKKLYQIGLQIPSQIISYRAMRIFTDHGVFKSDDNIVLEYSFKLNDTEYFFQKEAERNNYLIPISELNSVTIWVIVDKDDETNHVFYPPIF